MTVQDIIKQTKTFTTEQKQQLAYYFLFSSMDEDKKKDFTNLLHYEDEAENTKNTESDNIYSSIDKICGSGKGLWKEDAQIYINKLREDNRQF